MIQSSIRERAEAAIDVEVAVICGSDFHAVIRIAALRRTNPSAVHGGTLTRGGGMRGSWRLVLRMC
jgi:hypothetical protein